MINFALLSNVCIASDIPLEGEGGEAPPSQARFEPDPLKDDEEASTEVAQTTLQNTPFDEKEFVSIEAQKKVPVTIHVNGGMFDQLAIPHSTMLYAEITLVNCSCFHPLDPSTFQNNSELTRVVFNGSNLNLRQFEEKFGEDCVNLTYIDLQRFVDVSVKEQPLMTPERFAQIAHPCLLQRILGGHCIVLISRPDIPEECYKEECYKLEEMKEKFLSSVLQLRSLTKAKETLSIYQTLIDMISIGASKLGSAQLATKAGKAGKDFIFALAAQ